MEGIAQFRIRVRLRKISAGLVRVYEIPANRTRSELTERGLSVWKYFLQVRASLTTYLDTNCRGIGDASS